MFSYFFFLFPKFRNIKPNIPYLPGKYNSDSLKELLRLAKLLIGRKYSKKFPSPGVSRRRDLGK